MSARWSPDWLDGTLGFYYRNATDVFPQAMATPGVAPVPAAVCSARGGVPLPGGTLCFVNPKATTVADLQKFGKLGLYNGAYGDDIHIYGITLAKSIGGVSVGAEVSYRQNMPLVERSGPGTPRGIRPARTRLDRNDGGAVEGHARRARRHVARRAQRHQHLPEDPAVRHRGARGRAHLDAWSKVTQNEAVFKGRSGYTAIDKPTKDFFGLAINFTPTWFQVFPGVDLLAPITWSQGISGNAAVLFGGSEGGGNWSAGIAADIYQKYRIDLKYNGYYGDYSTNPTTATPAGGVLGVPNGANASLSDRGWVSLTFKTTF